MSDQKTKCDVCNRAEKYFDGCSVVECPKRKAITAAIDGPVFSEKTYYASIGAYFKVPSSKDEDDDA